MHTIIPTEKTEELRQKLQLARDILLEANKLYIELCPKMSDEFLSIYPIELEDKVYKLAKEIPMLKGDLFKFMEKKGII